MGGFACLFVEIVRRSLEEDAEFLFVLRLVVGLLGSDASGAKMLHDRVVERLVSLALADLHHARNLVRLAFANEVRDRRIDHQNFECGDAAGLVDPLEKILRDDALKRFREAGADLSNVVRIRLATQAIGAARSAAKRLSVAPTSTFFGVCKGIPVIGPVPAPPEGCGDYADERNRVQVLARQMLRADAFGAHTRQRALQAHGRNLARDKEGTPFPVGSTSVVRCPCSSVIVVRSRWRKRW